MNHHVMLTVGSLFWGGITINQSISFHPKKSGEVGADPPPPDAGALKTAHVRSTFDLHAALAALLQHLGA